MPRGSRTNLNNFPIRSYCHSLYCVISCEIRFACVPEKTNLLANTSSSPHKLYSMYCLNAFFGAKCARSCLTGSFIQTPSRHKSLPCSSVPLSSLSIIIFYNNCLSNPSSLTLEAFSTTSKSLRQSDNFHDEITIRSHHVTTTAWENHLSIPANCYELTMPF